MTAHRAELQFHPLTPFAGVEVRGVDLSVEQPQEVQRRLREAWNEHALLLFRDQQLTEEQQLATARIFGELSYQGEYDVQHYISNVDPAGVSPVGELAFHMDHSFYDEPVSGIILYAVEVPPPGCGGTTVFADVRRVLGVLPSELRARIERLEVVHTYPDQKNHKPIPGPDPRPGMPSATHPLVFTHPVTGEKLLFCSPRHFDHIVGLNAEESVALATELAEYVKQPDNVYDHQWRPGDLAIWDNLALQHARTDFDKRHRRHLRRTQIGELVPARA
ncbi:MAG: TauD/TfdA family dioxygenase [Vulcanimicrobiaceae bacterium]